MIQLQTQQQQHHQRRFNILIIICLQYLLHEVCVCTLLWPGTVLSLETQRSLVSDKKWAVC